MRRKAHTRRLKSGKVVQVQASFSPGRNRKPTRAEALAVIKSASKKHPLDLVARLDYLDRLAFKTKHPQKRENIYAAMRLTRGGRI